MKDLKVAICFIAFSFLFTSISFSQKNDCAQVKEEVKYILEMPEAASYAAKVTERIIGNPDCFSEAETALLQGKLSKLIGSKVDLSPRNESTAKGPGIDTNAKGSTRPQTRPETKSETKPNSTVTANPVMRSEEKAVTRMAESKPTNGAVLNGSPETKRQPKLWK